ncbi:beta barrel domain-containing protein [Streptomyces tricolor]
MAATGLADVKVGDPLVLVTGNRFRGDEPVTVSRIGTKYLYVTLHGHERRERFNRKTGVEEGNVGIRARLMTQPQYDEMKQRESLFMELLAAGINVKHEVRPEVTTDQLRALLAVIKPAA